MFDFPSPATLGQQVVSPTGAVFLWDGAKWGAAKNNAMAAGAAFLPLAGGTMEGPLNYTATGGTTVRSAQDRSADVANVLDFGADPTGSADSTLAFRGALALGKAVYAPTGRYILTGQIVVGAGQTLYGDGRSATVLGVGANFSTTDTGVISLTGRELQSPTVRDLQIQFAQTSTQAVRANFKTLAAGGSLATGIMYPPAIIITSANRFRLSNLSVSGAWDGIVNSAANAGGIGGYFIDNIEMGALNCGLWIDNAFDTGHIKSWHAYPFGVGSGNVFTGVYLDGNTFAARFGVNGNAQAVLIEDFFSLEARVQINNSNTWIQFANLGLDGNGARLEILGALWVMVANIYISAGANPNPQITQTGAAVTMITNLYGGGWINIGAGTMYLDHASPGAQQTTLPLIRQTGGVLYVRNSTLVAPTGLGAWTTVPLVNSTAGQLVFTDNVFSPMPAGTTQPGLACLDQATNVVAANTFSGWSYPAQTNTGGGTSGNVTAAAVTAANALTLGSNTTNAFMAFIMNAAATNYRIWAMQTAGVNRWTVGADNTDNFVINACDNTGTALPIPPLAILRSTGMTTIGDGLSFGGQVGAANNDFTKHLTLHTAGYGIGITGGRQNYVAAGAAGHFFISNNLDIMSVSSGGISMLRMPSSTTYANDAAAATGGVAVGQLYRNGSVIQIRVA